MLMCSDLRGSHRGDGPTDKLKELPAWLISQAKNLEEMYVYCFNRINVYCQTCSHMQTSNMLHSTLHKTGSLIVDLFVCMHVRMHHVCMGACMRVCSRSRYCIWVLQLLWLTADQVHPCRHLCSTSKASRIVSEHACSLAPV